MDKNKLEIAPGNPLIPGASFAQGTCNFAIEAREDAQVSLLLYKENEAEPWMEIPLGREERCGCMYAVRVSPLDAKDISYNYQIDGKVVSDPCGKVFLGRGRFGSAINPEKPHEVRCGLLSMEDGASWEKEYTRPSLEEMILYKLHVRGFTKACPEVALPKRGTFAGLQERIPYLLELGINTVELMPCYEFWEVAPPAPGGGMVAPKQTGAKLNYWGYGPGCYFAPKASYCMGSDAQEEVRSLIRALHEAGIACIMEFYFPAQVSPSMVIHALHFWKLHYHVDGFHLLGEGAALSMVLRDAMLSDTLIFTPQESFPEGDLDKKKPSSSFATYNSGFMEDMRRFMKSDEGMVDSVRYRFSRGEKGYGVINYMAFQDGFTLKDMVSYNYRHNEDNGEGGEDGCEQNYSWNCGAEGPSRKASIRSLREQQERNALALLLLSRGTPMIYAGDEFGNSQKGNNNAYCQDNAVGWVDWKALGQHKRLFAFCKAMVAFRKEHPILWSEEQGEGKAYKGKGYPVLSFHGERAWFCSNEASSRLLGVMYAQKGEQERHYYIAMNFYWEERDIALPTLSHGGVWKAVFSTDQKENWWEGQEEDPRKSLSLPPRSITFLEGVAGPKKEKEEKEVENQEEEKDNKEELQEKPEEKPEEKIEEKSEEKLEEKPEEKAEEKPEEKPRRGRTKKKAEKEEKEKEA
ncbi:MAG: Type II secretory pathway, pullulanase PulA and related glycosidase [Blautia sp.]|nr:Type II secretory pathway, pullulanase PulA and related glycosidase [Blautia sp.]